MMNEEWTGGPNLLQVVVVLNGERSEEERELQKSGLGFWSIRSSELGSARANHSLDERSDVLKHSLLERTTLWMKALERTRVCSSDHFFVWARLSELRVRSSDHFSVWVRSSKLESARANLILDRALIEAENLANRSDLTVWSIQLVLDF